MAGRRALLFFLVAALVLLSFQGVAFCKSKKLRVAVVDFENNAGPEVNDAVRRAITDMLTTELWKTNLFTIVERSRLEAIAQEQNLAASGLVDATTAVRLGKLLGVEAIITGSITQFTLKQQGGVIPIPQLGGIAIGESKAYVTLDVRVINAETGEIMLVARETGEAKRSLGGVAFSGVIYGQREAEGILAAATYKCIQKIVAKLKQLFVARGGGSSFHVVRVIGKTVYLDAGAINAGANPGDLYLVYVEGEPIVGLRGEILGVEKEYIALVELTEVNPRFSKGKIIKGYTPQKGDMVEPVYDKAMLDKIKFSPRLGGTATTTPAPQPTPQPTKPSKPSPQQPQPSPQPPQQPTGPSDIMNTSEEMVLINYYPISEELKNKIRILHKAAYYNYKKHRYSLAYKQFTKAYYLYKGNYLDAYWAARTAYKMGNRSKAKYWINVALKVNPNYIPAKKFKRAHKL